MAKLALYARLTRLNKPIGILLLLWPTLWALWIASDGRPPLAICLIFVSGTVLMRSAGCAINDYADRDFDLHVERTRDRPVTSGAVQPKEALLVALVLTLLAGSLLIGQNLLTWILALFAVAIAASYPYTKRFLAVPQGYLGIAFGFGIPIAFAALRNTVPLIAWLMLVCNIFWAIAYDTEYAMVDRDDDAKIGIRTSALTFGSFDVSAVMISYALSLSGLLVIGRMAGRGLWFNGGVALAAGIALYHYTLIRTRSREGCFKAFLNNNCLGAVVFLGLLLDYTI